MSKLFGSVMFNGAGRSNRSTRFNGRTRKLVFESLEVRQLLTVAAPTSIVFVPGTGQGTTAITSANNSSTTEELSFTVSDVTAGNTVKVYANANTAPIATGTVQSGQTTITVTTLGNASLINGAYTFTATQTDSTSTESSKSPTASLQIFNGLTATITSTRAATATVNSAFSYAYTLTSNAPSGDTVTYSLPSTSAPSGMSFNASSNTATWTPASGDAGSTQSFTLSGTDTAGNTVTLLPVFVSVAAASAMTVITPPTTVAFNSPVLVGFSDTNTGTPHYTVTTSSSGDTTGANLTGTVLTQSNPVLKIATDQGDMYFQLLQNYTPKTVAQIESLVAAGVYNPSTYTNFTGTFVLYVGNTATAAINFDTNNLAGTATNIQNALRAAGYSGATVTVNSSATFPHFSFDVTFSTAETPISYSQGATPLPVSFSNSASNSSNSPAAQQTLTFAAAVPEFYRIINTFMDQGGVSGLANVSPFPVELNSNLRFTSSGLLAMANNGEDGNSSEFFVTNPDDMSNGFLDFRYTIFGKLISGDAVRAAIGSTPVTTNSSGENSQPLTPPKILSMSIVPPSTSGVLQLNALSGATVGSTYTVNVSDGLGGTQSFTIHIGFSGPLVLKVGNTSSSPTTSQISFDSSNLTSTAANIRSALVALGDSGTTVSVDSGSTATSLRFDVTFSSSQAPITATVSNLPVAFSNSVTADSATQVLTFNVTGAGAYDPPTPWVNPINGADKINMTTGSTSTFTPTTSSADGSPVQVSVQAMLNVPSYGIYVDSSYANSTFESSAPVTSTNADITLTQNGSSYTITPAKGFYGAQVLEVMGFTPVTTTSPATSGHGTFELLVGTATTAPISFDSTNLTATAANIQAALRNAGFNSATVTVNQGTAAPSFVFDVKFNTSLAQADISYVADSTNPLPLSFANAATSAAASQQITFTSTSPSWTSNPVYRAFVPVYVAPAAPVLSSISVGGKTISGSTFYNNGDASSQFTFNISGVVSGATVGVYVDGSSTPLVSGAASGTSISLTTTGSTANRISDGSHTFTVKETIATQGLTLFADFQSAAAATSAGSSQSNWGAQFGISPSSVQSASSGTSLTIGLYVLDTPVTKARQGAVYTYVVQTNAPAGDAITVNQSTLVMPSGMTFDGAATFTWTPSASQLNTSPTFQAQVSDSQGRTITIGPVNITVTLGLTPTQVPVSSAGGNVTVSFSGGNAVVYDNLAKTTLSSQSFNSTDMVEIDLPAGQANAVTVALSGSGAIPREVVITGAANATNNQVTVNGAAGNGFFAVDQDMVTTTNNLLVAYPAAQKVTLVGGGGNNRYWLWSTAVPLTIVNTSNQGTLDFSRSAAGVAVNLGLYHGQAQPMWNSTLALNGVLSEIIGSAYNDVLTGGPAATTIIHSGAGNDRIGGGSGNNILVGGGGNDTITGGPNKNLIIGGSGNSSLYANGSSNTVIAGSTNYDANDAALINLLNQGPLVVYGYSMRRALASVAKNAALKATLLTPLAWGHDTIFGSGSNNWYVPGPYGVVK